MLHVYKIGVQGTYAEGLLIILNKLNNVILPIISYSHGISCLLHHIKFLLNTSLIRLTVFATTKRTFYIKVLQKL
jgi:hypothetical protein